MKNLELSIDREIEFMIKYQLTADELFFMKLIVLVPGGVRVRRTIYGNRKCKRNYRVY